MKVIQSTLVNKARENDAKLAEVANTIESYKRQVGEMSNVLKARDTTIAKESSARREAEIELEKLQVRVDEVTRSLEAERTKGSENSQIEALRVSLAIIFWLRATSLICSSPSLSVRFASQNGKILLSARVVTCFASHVLRKGLLHGLENVQPVRVHSLQLISFLSTWESRAFPSYFLFLLLLFFLFILLFFSFISCFFLFFPCLLHWLLLYLGVWVHAALLSFATFTGFRNSIISEIFS